MANMMRYIYKFIFGCCNISVFKGFISFWMARKRHFYVNMRKMQFASCGEKCDIGRFSSLLGSEYIYLGNCVRIGNEVVLEAWDYYPFTGQKFTPLITIGNNSSIGDYSHIGSICKIRIGNGVRMGRYIFISDHSHGDGSYEQLNTPANLRPLTTKGPIIIDDNVWIGEKASVLAGVHIGYGAIIGANAVVTKDIPPYSIAVGNPAKVIRTMIK